MPTVAANGIEIAYETFGDPADPALLLVSGLGSQMVSWDPTFCEGFVDRGFFVIRFDNRDTGLSTKFTMDDGVDLLGAITAVMSGEATTPPYLLSDMAADAAGLLDAIGVEQAHAVGASMGGMIVQTMAIEQRHKLLSMTSIMSTTGDSDVGSTKPEVFPVLLTTLPSERDAYIAASVEVSRTIGSPEHFEEDRARARAALAFDRCYHPRGTGQQLLAIMASGSRSDRLREVDINALVIHGDCDPLVDVSGGERTAEVIAGAELLILEGMGHDLPSTYWAGIIEAITNLAARSAAPA